ncbi:MAG: SulP family inorganic anion transporter [Betaproteobacteria bacterium]|nr:SulP family inorganic anion transporter [Betaproteobacteria bacterium]
MASPPTLLVRWLPFLQWWPLINRDTVRADLIAGLIGAVVVIPQGVAFATIAGMPAEYGLYLAMIPAVVAALWGSSWHAVSGPTTAVSIFVFATLAPLATPGSAEYIGLALTLSLMSGLLMLALGLGRLGVIVNFISHTVVLGFTAGAAFLIAASQLANALGISLPRGQSFFQTLCATAASLSEVNVFAVTVAVATVVGGMLSRRYFRTVPYMIVALVAGSVAGMLLNVLFEGERTGLQMIAAPSSAWPPFSTPNFSPEAFRQLAGIAIAVTVLSLTEAISIARAIALRSGQRIDGNQEFIGQGLANITASFFSGYPSSASFNRSGLNFDAGARTPLAAVFSALLLIVLLTFVAPLIGYIPMATLAGILFLVAWGLIDFAGMQAVRKVSRNETWVLAITFVATLTLNLEIAILVGVLASLIVYLHRTSHPIMRSLVPDAHHSERKMIEVDAMRKECPQVKILRIEGSIYFGAVDHVSAHLEGYRKAHPEQKHLVCMSKSINFVDAAGVALLANEARQRAKINGQLYFYSLRRPVYNMLERAGCLDGIGREHLFASKDEAIAKIFRHLDRAICAGCTARIFLECQTIPYDAAAK